MGKHFPALILWSLALPALAGCPPSNERSSSDGVDSGLVFAEKPVFRPVPRGLKGLSFGMSQEEVRKALPAVAAGQKDPGFDMGRLMHQQELEQRLPGIPGERLVSRTEIGTEPANCMMVFIGGGGLSAMACRLDPLSSLENHLRVERAVLEALIRNYGEPKIRPVQNPADPYPISSGHKSRWVWQDESARLELTSEFNDPFAGMAGPGPALGPTSEIYLINESGEALSMKAALERVEDRRQRDAEAEAIRRQEEEQRRIQEGARKFDKDL